MKSKTGNKIGLVIMIATVFFHFLLLMNKTYGHFVPGYYNTKTLEPYYIPDLYLGIPYSVFNVLYCLYFLYVVLFAIGVFNIKVMFGRKEK